MSGSELRGAACGHGPWWSGRGHGAGWADGKNCLIIRTGSFGFLAVLVTSLEVSTERAGIAHVDLLVYVGLIPYLRRDSNYADFARLRLRC